MLSMKIGIGAVTIRYNCAVDIAAIIPPSRTKPETVLEACLMRFKCL